MTTSVPINLIPKGTKPQPETDESCNCTPATLVNDQVAANARLLSALADPTRLGIVSMLAGADEPVCVCEIVPRFELGQPTISHHLRVLREARLVDCEKRGLWVYYWLNRDVFSTVAEYLNMLQRMTSGALAL
jgi:ArsR family transcriptional regulator